MNPEPELLIKLAKEHHGKLPFSPESIDFESFDQLAGECIRTIILSAAAVESAINLEISLPVTSLKPPSQREYFFEITLLAQRSSIWRKLSFLIKQKPGLEFTKKENQALRDLFKIRNQIVHANPEYKEYPTESPHTNGLSKESIDSCDGVLSVLSMTSSTTNIIWESSNAYEAAKMFLGKLRGKYEDKYFS